MRFEKTDKGWKKLGCYAFRGFQKDEEIDAFRGFCSLHKECGDCFCHGFSLGISVEPVSVLEIRSGYCILLKSEVLKM